MDNWCLAACETVNNFASFKHNWDSYGAKPIDENIIRVVKMFLSQMYSNKIPKPNGISPTTKGGIEIEWADWGMDLAIEFDPYWKIHVYLEDYHEKYEQAFELEYENVIDKIVEIIRKYKDKQ